MLHKMKALSYDQWVDAQMIYAYQRYGTNQQYSVAHANGGSQYIDGAFVCSQRFA